MDFYKNNAYPEIFLHDCQFKLVYENQNLKLVFDNGFYKENSGSCTMKKGYIQISDISLDEIDIRVFKMKTRFWKFKEIGRYMDFADLKEFFENYSLEVIEEYYSYGGVLYKCSPYPYNPKQPFDRLELVITHENRPLEYYL